MKIPREILLARHQEMNSALNAISRNVAANCRTSEAEARPLWHVIREWLWPSPVAWAGVAAGWLVVIALNVGVPHAPAPIAKAAPVSAERLEAAREQRRFLVELVAPEASESREADRERFIPRPRSERRLTVGMA